MALRICGASCSGRNGITKPLSLDNTPSALLFANGYKTIRDKLISHNELRPSPDGYSFFDVKQAKLKYGDERQLLETLQVLVDHLLLIVRNVDFSWDSFFRNQEQVARDFWEVNAA
jgi:hypothetical protein